MKIATFSLYRLLQEPALWRSATTGALIGLFLIAAFLFSADEGSPGWGPYWMARPLIVVPIAGAACGVCAYLLAPLRQAEGWKGAMGFLLTFLVYLIGLWLGTVAGLDGTYWN
ncbi:potassium transporter KefB [Phaeodactylibacter luteus]|uniref:Potassium transporter KefB n=1 Tax=Phaeodactylibacter luteus TaxID=1564516 RepID=A0A5C6S5V3_9BACT|nr:potassium transporter KefB [Phaeodactylibacter luteus]TXB70228.1 potassium transporter KefB [Phaeodactylibacter luteus]